MDTSALTQKPSHPISLVILVAASLVFTLWIAGFYAALEATPYETTDSAGRTMGFNDVFSSEHYAIIRSKMSPARTSAALGWYDFLLILAHFTMAVMLVRGTHRRWVLGFCALQPVVFFWGLFGLLGIPIGLFALLRGSTSDREGFTDIPYVPIMAGGGWLIACAAIALRTWLAGRAPRR